MSLTKKAFPAAFQERRSPGSTSKISYSFLAKACGAPRCPVLGYFITFQRAGQVTTMSLSMRMGLLLVVDDLFIWLVGGCTARSSWYENGNKFPDEV